MPNGENSAQSDTPTVYIKSRHDDGPTSSKPLQGFNPDDLVGRTLLLPRRDNGETLRVKVTRKVVEDIGQADGERIHKISSYLVYKAMVNWRKLYPTANLLIIWTLQPMTTARSVMICLRFEPPLATWDPSSQQTPIGKDASIMSLLIG